MRMDADQKFTVAAERPSGVPDTPSSSRTCHRGQNWAASELVATRPASCPADPAPTADKFPAVRGIGFEIEDAG